MPVTAVARSVARKIGKGSRSSRCTPRWRWPGRWASTTCRRPSARAASSSRCSAGCANEKIERWNKPIHPAEAEPLRWLLRCWIELVHGYALDYVGPGHPVLPKDIEDRDADVLGAAAGGR